MTGRKTSACSDKCRAAKSRRGWLTLLVAEAAATRASLQAALDAMWETAATLEQHGAGAVRGKRNDGQ